MYTGEPRRHAIAVYSRPTVFSPEKAAGSPRRSTGAAGETNPPFHRDIHPYVDESIIACFGTIVNEVLIIAGKGALIFDEIPSIFIQRW